MHRKHNTIYKTRKKVKSRRVSRKPRRVSRKPRRVSRKSRRVSRKPRRVSRKHRRVSRKSRRVSRKSRRVSRKSRRVSRKSRRSRVILSNYNKKQKKINRKFRMKGEEPLSDYNNLINTDKIIIDYMGYTELLNLINSGYTDKYIQDAFNRVGKLMIYKKINVSQVEEGEEFKVLFLSGVKKLQQLKFFNDLISIEFDENFNEDIVINSIPNSVQELYFPEDFRSKIQPGALPSNLYSLDMSGNYYFNQDLAGILPPNLKILKLSYLFNQKLKKNDLPESLIYLKFGEHFNKPIKKFLPKNLKTLIFGANFNQELEMNDLPVSLIHLEFGEYFNKQIKFFLPKKLKTLIFKGEFNQSLYFKKNNNILPLSLEYLDLGYHFKKEIISGNLPQKLKILILSNVYDKNIKENVLPDSLLEIRVHETYKHISNEVIPLEKVYTYDYDYNDNCVYTKYIV